MYSPQVMAYSTETPFQLMRLISWSKRKSNQATEYLKKPSWMIRKSELVQSKINQNLKKSSSQSYLRKTWMNKKTQMKSRCKISTTKTSCVRSLKANKVIEKLSIGSCSSTPQSKGLGWCKRLSYRKQVPLWETVTDRLFSSVKSKTL